MDQRDVFLRNLYRLFVRCAETKDAEYDQALSALMDGLARIPDVLSDSASEGAK